MPLKLILLSLFNDFFTILKQYCQLIFHLHGIIPVGSYQALSSSTILSVFSIDSEIKITYMIIVSNFSVEWAYQSLNWTIFGSSLVPSTLSGVYNDLMRISSWTMRRWLEKRKLFESKYVLVSTMSIIVWIVHSIHHISPFILSDPYTVHYNRPSAIISEYRRM